MCGTCSRYAHADSSPIAGYDWLWTQCTEIQDSKIFATYRAINSLQAAASTWVSGHKPPDNVDDDDAGGEDSFGRSVGRSVGSGHATVGPWAKASAGRSASAGRVVSR